MNFFYSRGIKVHSVFYCVCVLFGARECPGHCLHNDPSHLLLPPVQRDLQRCTPDLTYMARCAASVFTSSLAAAILPSCVAGGCLGGRGRQEPSPGTESIDAAAAGAVTRARRAINPCGRTEAPPSRPGSRAGRRVPGPRLLVRLRVRVWPAGAGVGPRKSARAAATTHEGVLPKGPWRAGRGAGRKNKYLP